MKRWTVQEWQAASNHLLRIDGRVEWQCPHGIGHPVGVCGRDWEPWMGVHGCDGCCRQHMTDSTCPRP